MIKAISMTIVAGTGTSTFERGSITDFRRALAVGLAPVGFRLVPRQRSLMVVESDRKGRTLRTT